MEAKSKIIEYMESQLRLKTDSLKALDVPIISEDGKRELEKESMLIRHDIYELQRHIQVIKML